MIAVVVELRKLHERHPANPGRIDVGIGDRVLISTVNGLETAVVVELEKIINEKKVEMKIIRQLNDNDYRILEENKEHVLKVLPDVTKTIEEENLDMKLAEVSYTYDRQKLFIYYTADTRVDFRKFIRVLGAKFKIRIQMVQIGVRDKVSIVGGLGMCGREVCCNKFLKNIESVNIDMARNQHISLNPENISGICGRLLCCLRYENDFYESVRKGLPEIGMKVTTPVGKGEVVNLNFLKKTVSVKLRSGAVNEFNAGDVRTGVREKIRKWIK